MGNPLYTVGEHSRGSFGFGRRDADGADDADGQPGVEGPSPGSTGGAASAALGDDEARLSAAAPTQGSAALEATTGVRAFAEIERTQRLAANVSDDSPLLKRSDKCCNAKKFEAARCCKPHAVFWQSG